MEDERGSPLARRRSAENVSSGRQAESGTEPQFPKNPEKLDVPCTEDCPRSRSFSAGRNYGKSESSENCLPVGIRALYQIDEGPQSRNTIRASSPLRSKSNSRSSPLRSSSPSENGKNQCSSAHYSPETCDPDIAAIIYRSSSDEGRTPSRKRKIPKVNFPCFGKMKEKKPECWIEKHRSDYLSMTAEEQERARKEKAWKKIREGKHGKTIIQKQSEWERGLRQYDYCSSWQRHIGEDTRKRHQDKLIKAAVREKPISKIQEIRTDAKMMENDLFETSKSLDDYKQKTHQIVNVFHSKRQFQGDQEAFLAANPPKKDWRKSVAKVGLKLKELLPAKKSSLSQLFGGQSSLTSSHEPVSATPCSCRAKEIKPIRRSSQEDSKEDALNKPLNKPFSNPRKVIYKPNLKRIKPSYRDKDRAVGWNHTLPSADQEESDDDEAMAKSPHHRSGNVKKSRGRPTKAQILHEARLDADEWSIIDHDSPKFANQFKCFGYFSPSNLRGQRTV